MKTYIKKYTVRKISDYLFVLVEHVSHGLYLQHNPMPFVAVLDSLMRATSKQRVRVGFIHTGDDIIERCTHGQCNKLCNGFTVDNYPFGLEIGYPFCDTHALEHVAFLNFKIRKNEEITHAKR